MPRVLLFTASFGSGHNQACHAVKERLVEKGAVVKEVDLVNLLHPVVRPIVTLVFLEVLKKAPWLYGVFYDALSTGQTKSFVEKQLFRLGRRKISSILQSFRPDVVCSTHPTSVGILSELRHQGMTAVPNVVVITDYTAHGHWVHPNVDLYCVACDEVGRELQRMDVPDHKILVTGLPIRKVFNDMQVVRDDHVRRLQLRLQNGIDAKKPLFLVMGGGEGIIGTASMWERITKRIDAQFAIVCGHNQSLYNKLRFLESDKVRVFGYVPNIEQWMTMADMLITKAGGLTITEAVSLGLPILLFRPIPGQEHSNACYAVKRGCAQLIYSLADAERRMSEFVAQREQRAAFHSGIANRDTSKASNRIAQLLLDPERLTDLATPHRTWVAAASE